MKSAQRRITLTATSAAIVLKNKKPNEKLSETLDRLLNLNPFLTLIPEEVFQDHDEP